MITLTFPDGAERQYAPGTTGRAIAEGIAKSLAKRTVAMALDGELADLDDAIARDARIEFVSRDDRARPRAHPPRRRARPRRSRADAASRHAGDHRPGDRERVLLRFRPQRAVHARRLSRHRGQDARDHRARRALHQGGVEPRGGEERVPRQGRAFQGRARRRHSRRREPEDLPAGRMVRPLPRPAHDLDRQGRQRLQAHEGGRRLLARRRRATRC